MSETSRPESYALTADFDRRLELEKDGLTDEDFTSAGTEVLDLVLLQSYGFARSVPSDWG